jgi:aerobic-type carbon monoxide dehydrogenase small subunit (CoxS/CutS family)
MTASINLFVNGEQHDLAVAPQDTLLDVLRRRLELTGTKLGCDQQVCGACTVLMDELPVSSCSVLALDANGKQILTIEGLARNGDLHAIQKAFIAHGAFQCAYCTSGLILAVKSLLEQIPSANEQQIRRFLSGNICRCGCHMEIIEVVKYLLAEQRKEGR